VSGCLPSGRRGGDGTTTVSGSAAAPAAQSRGGNGIYGEPDPRIGADTVLRSRCGRGEGATGASAFAFAARWLAGGGAVPGTRGARR